MWNWQTTRKQRSRFVTRSACSRTIKVSEEHSLLSKHLMIVMIIIVMMSSTSVQYGHLIQITGNWCYHHRVLREFWRKLQKILTRLCRIPVVQWLAEKLAVSISVIRKVARILLYVKIQNILIKDVLKTWKFAMSFSIKTFRNLKVTIILD